MALITPVFGIQVGTFTGLILEDTFTSRNLAALAVSDHSPCRKYGLLCSTNGPVHLGFWAESGPVDLAAGLRAGYAGRRSVRVALLL